MKFEDIYPYINQARSLGIVPNFWLSAEYLSYQEKCKLVQNKWAVWIEEDGKLLFPPLPLQGALGDTRGFPTNVPIWSDFANYSVGNPIEFLDYEYSYRASDFRNLNGKMWAVFRKNIRKWPARNPNWRHSMCDSLTKEEDICKLLIRWLEARKDAEIHDFDTMERYVFHGQNRYFLFAERDRLVGMNIWDMCDNRHRIYRYCIADPDEPFLDEFLRYQFYTYNVYDPKFDKIVIDGGVLGNRGLERFKDRLNPFRKRMIFTRK